MIKIEKGHEGDNEYAKALKMISANNFELKRDFIRMFAEGEISLEEIIEKSQSSSLEILKKIRIADLISALDHWDKKTTQQAMIQYGLDVRTKVSDLTRSRGKLNSVLVLIDSTPSELKMRIKAPEGFPWRGNVLEAVQQLKEEQLPEEIRKATRFYFDDDVLFHDVEDDLDDDYQEDNLDELFASSVVDDDDDLDADVSYDNDDDDDDDDLSSYLFDDD